MSFTSSRLGVSSYTRPDDSAKKIADLTAQLEAAQRAAADAHRQAARRTTAYEAELQRMRDQAAALTARAEAAEAEAVAARSHANELADLAAQPALSDAPGVAEKERVARLHAVWTATRLELERRTGLYNELYAYALEMRNCADTNADVARTIESEYRKLRAVVEQANVAYDQLRAAFSERLNEYEQTLPVLQKENAEMHALFETVKKFFV